MKYMLCAALLLTGCALAQNTPASVKTVGPSYSDQYCAGFYADHKLPSTHFIVGGKGSPYEVRYSSRSEVFIKGDGLQKGERYSVVRPIRDPNLIEVFPGQTKILKSMGTPYADLGWLTVKELYNGGAVADYSFACDTAVPGDLIVPFRERPAVPYRSEMQPFQAFGVPNDGVRGRIALGREFDTISGANRIVYVDLGSDKGVKPGDYLRVVRSYGKEDLQKVDQLSEVMTDGTEDTAANPPKPKGDPRKYMPEQGVGELLVLSVSQKSATTLVMRSTVPVEIGDYVQPEK